MTAKVENSKVEKIEREILMRQRRGLAGNVSCRQYQPPPRVPGRKEVLSHLIALYLGALTFSVSLCAGLSESSLNVRSLRQISESTPLIEIPNVVERLLKETPPEDRSRIGIRIARVFLQGRPALGPSLVSTICRVAPRAAATVTVEAVRLFPEHCFSIIRAAVLAAPEFAIPITLFAVLAEPNRTSELLSGFRKSHPELVDEMQEVVSFLKSDRVTTLADAVFTTKIRIGTSFSNAPANPDDSRDNNPPPAEQLRFPDLPDEVPEDLSGTEVVSQFDRILRELYVGDDSQFDDGIVVESYVR